MTKPHHRTRRETPNPPDSGGMARGSHAALSEISNPESDTPGNEAFFQDARAIPAPRFALLSQRATIESAVRSGIVICIERSRDSCSAGVALNVGIAHLRSALMTYRAVLDLHEHAAVSGWQEGNDSLFGPRVRQPLPPVQLHPIWDDAECPVFRRVEKQKTPLMRSRTAGPS